MSKQPRELIGNTSKIVEVIVQGHLNPPYPTYAKVDSTTFVTDGMQVVVDTTGHGKYFVAEVIGTYSASDIINAEKIVDAKIWVVSAVSDEAHKARISATVKRAAIIKQLDERKKQVDVVQMYEAIANIDPEAKKLLKELKEVTGAVTQLSIPPQGE